MIRSGCIDIRRPRESGGPEPAPGLNRGQPLVACPGSPLSRGRPASRRCREDVHQARFAASAAACCGPCPRAYGRHSQAEALLPGVARVVASRAGQKRLPQLPMSPTKGCGRVRTSVRSRPWDLPVPARFARSLSRSKDRLQLRARRAVGLGNLPGASPVERSRLH